LVTIDESHIGQLNSEFRSALNAAGLFRFDDTAAEHLPALRDNNSVSDHRIHQAC
jgi:hypothetical protein